MTPTTTVDRPGSAVAFPMPPLTKEEILEVADCDIKALASTRYPQTVGEEGLLQAFGPASNCDWAVLSYAYAERNQGDMPSSPGVEALSHAISGNWAYAMATQLYYPYFGTVHIVDNAGTKYPEITRADVTYDWTGLGDPGRVQFAFSIEQADTEPTVTRRAGSIPDGKAVSKEAIQDLSNGLNDLLPVDSRIQVVPCTDNYPTWEVKLRFTDGSTLDLESSSNVLGFGGPWETEIDGQVYVQYGPEFAVKLYRVIDELGLELGQPAAWTCFETPVFEQAFGQHLPATATPTYDAELDAIYTAAASTAKAMMTAEAMGTPNP